MRNPIKPIRWGAREQALLDALRARADAEGVALPSDAEAVRVAMAVAVEATGPAWERAKKKTSTP